MDKINGNILVSVTTDKKECLFGNTELQQDVVFKASLNEGISLPFELVLTVLSSRCYSRSELSKQLSNAKFEICFEHKDNEGALLRARTLEGIVTSFVLKGKFSSSLKDDKIKDCYCYELTINPEFEKLYRIKKTVSYRDKSVKEIINNIIKANGLNGEIKINSFNNELIDNTYFTFEQYKESDGEFIDRLCMYFGINYAFGKTTNGAFGVIFSRDFDPLVTFPVITYSNKVEHEVTCKLNKNAAILKDDYFVESVNFRASVIYEDDNTKLDKQASRLMSVFTGNLNLDKDVIKKQKNIFIENLKQIKANKDEFAIADAKDFIYAPGVRVSFDSSSGFVPTGKFIIVRNALEVFCKYPDGFPKDLSDNSDQNSIKQKFIVFNTSPEENVDSKILGSLGVFSSLNLYDNDIKILDFSLKTLKMSRTTFGDFTVSPHLSNSIAEGIQLVRGVVCDSTGNCDEDTANNDDRFDPSSNFYNLDKFYVKTSEHSSPVVCQYIGSVASDVSSSIPRIGQNVMMLFDSNCYYLIGYYPDNLDSKVHNNNYAKSKANSVTLASVGNSKSLVDKDGITVEDFSEEKISSFAYYFFNNKLDFYISILTDKYNDLRINSDYFNENGKNNLSLSYKKYVLETDSQVTTTNVNKTLSYADWGKEIYSLLESIESEKDEVKSQNRASYDDLSNDYLSKLTTFINTIISEDKKTVQSEKSSGNLLSIKSSGSVHAFTTQGASLNLDKDVILSSDSGKVILSSTDAIDISSQKRISLSVGNSQLSITPAGIKISCQKLPVSVPLYDSSISIDSLNGISLNGCDVNLKGFTSVKLSDSFGGCLATGLGDVKIVGNRILNTTNSRRNVISILEKLASSIVNVPLSINSCPPVVSKCCVSFPDAVTSIFTEILDILDLELKPGATGGFVYVMKAVGVVCKVVDELESLVIAIMDGVDENDASGYQKRMPDNYISQRDIFKLVIASISKVSLILSSMPLFFKALKSNTISSIKLEGDEEVKVIKKQASFFRSKTSGSTVIHVENDVPIVANEDEDKPDGDPVASKDQEKPKGGTVASEEQDKPDGDPVASKDQDKPKGGTVASEEQEKPKGGTVASEEQEKPKGGTVVSEEQEKPKGGTVASEEQDKPDGDPVASEEQEKPDGDPVVSEEKDKSKDTLVIKVAAQTCATVASIAVKSAFVSSSLAATVTNYDKKDFTGNKTVSPTNDETSLESRESTGVDNDSSLAKDDVAAQKGEVDAAETEGKAATTEATAADSGASALKTKAGATDIATKGIKLN